ncbi:methyltransferase domain-containing protein [Haloarchaeobius litoreus]|uniref:tRNA (guanine(10)-N(2))-dimethyltransferase n=1 Tax=Haloarchaeobius litoreus TaxID=755306 RepID=A0ABD6DKI3_9EURY
MYLLELGGEDDAFAACEAASAATGVERIGGGLAIAHSVATDRVRGLAYTRRASELLGRTDASVDSAVALLEAAPIDREGTVAVRARDVRGDTGVSTSDTERALGQVLVDRGFAVDLDDPDHELRALFAPASDDGDDSPEGPDVAAGEAGVCALGWLVTESVRDFGDRKPTDKPFFQPGSMDPLLARAVTNVAGAGPGSRILDPMCGTGGVLVEAGLVGADVVGVDAQAKMANGARQNLAHFLDDGDAHPIAEPGDWHVCRGDATRLPLVDDAVDAAVFDAPYGRQSKIETHALDDLVAGALAESRRVADRAVVVADRSWAGVARRAGWTVEASFERRVHRSLTRYVLVLD